MISSKYSPSTTQARSAQLQCTARTRAESSERSSALHFWGLQKATHLHRPEAPQDKITKPENNTATLENYLYWMVAE